MKNTKGGFNASILGKLFGKVADKINESKTTRKQLKNSKRAFKDAVKETKKNAKFTRAYEKASAKVERTNAKTQKKIDKYHNKSSIERQKDNLRKYFKDNPQMAEKFYDKHGLDVNQWVEDYGPMINKASVRLKDIIRRGDNKSIDHLIRKFAKNPTLENANAMESALSKSMNVDDRKFMSEFKKLLGQTLPIGFAVAVALTPIVDSD